MCRESGVLDERRLSVREIANRAIPEPAAPEPDVDVPCHCELGQRSPDETQVARRPVGDPPRIHEPPAAFPQESEVRLIGTVDVKGEPERRLDEPRQLR